MNTALVLSGFAVIVLAPVAAAYFFGQKSRKDSGTHKIAQTPPSDGPVVVHHMLPRPRKRKRR